MNDRTTLCVKACDGMSNHALERWLNPPEGSHGAPQGPWGKQLSEIWKLMNQMREHNLVDRLYIQREFSLRTFGPGPRTDGLIKHIKKELIEIEKDPTNLVEWLDVALLALDGAWRAGHEPEAIAAGLNDKQNINKTRIWPDWRLIEPDMPIEHIRDEDGI